MKRILGLVVVVAVGTRAVTIAEETVTASASNDDLLREIESLKTEMAELQGELSTLKAERTPADVPADAVAENAADTTTATPEDTFFTTGQIGDLPLAAGYDGWFYLRDDAGKFRLNIGAYTQFQYNMNWREESPPDEEDFSRGFEVRRTRIFFTGKYTEHFDYHLRLNIDSEGDVSLTNAYVQFNADEHWSIRAGEMFVALFREDWMYALDVLGADFSPNDYEFAIGTSLGFQGHYTSEKNRFWLAVTNGALGGKSEFTSVDTGDVAFSGRYEYQLAGTEWSVWDDLVGRQGRPFGVLLGLGGILQINEKESSDRAGRGGGVTADVSLNGDGYHVLVAGTWRGIDLDDESTYNNYGFLVQGGYFLTSYLQLYARYDLIDPGDEDGDLETFHAIAAGVNVFPFEWTNRYKLTLEFGYLFSALDETIVEPSTGLGYLPSDEPGQALLRLQLQFGF